MLAPDPVPMPAPDPLETVVDRPQVMQQMRTAFRANTKFVAEVDGLVAASSDPAVHALAAQVKAQGQQLNALIRYLKS